MMLMFSLCSDLRLLAQRDKIRHLAQPPLARPLAGLRPQLCGSLDRLHCGHRFLFLLSRLSLVRCPHSSHHTSTESGPVGCVCVAVALKNTQGQTLIISTVMATESQNTKVLVHALLCGTGRCARPDCTEEVQEMKVLLAKMEEHAKACTSIANHPNGGRRRSCDTCAKWLQLQKLRDRFTRQLLQAQGGRGRGASRAGGAVRKGGAGGSSSGPVLLKRSVTMVMESAEGDDSLDLSLLPQLVEGDMRTQRRRRDAKHSSAGGANSDSHSAATADETAAKGKGKGKGKDKETVAKVDALCGKDGCTKLAWHAGLCQVVLDTGRARQKRSREVEDPGDEPHGAAQKSQSMGPPPPRVSKKKVAAGASSSSAASASTSASSSGQLCGKDGCTKPAWHAGMCDVALDGARSRKRAAAGSESDATAAAKAAPAAARSKTAVKPSTLLLAEDGGVSSSPSSSSRLIQMITEGARLAQTPSHRGTRTGQEWSLPADANAPSNHGVTEDLFPPSVGMHVAIDSAREVSAELPDAWNNAIETKKPPAKSNVAEVTTVHTDGRCDVTLVCNCSAGREAKVQQLAPPAKASSKGKRGGGGGGGGRSKDDAAPFASVAEPASTTCLVGGGCCGAGSLVRGLTASQRQIVCSGCLEANLPHALPRLRCSACDVLFEAGESYRRAPPVGDSHHDVTLCEGCFDKLFSRYVDYRKEVLEDLDDEASSLEASAFARLTWQPEDERKSRHT